MSTGGLTADQRRRIEENRRKALEKRAALQSQRQQQIAPSVTDGADGKFASSRMVTTSREERCLFPRGSSIKSREPQRQVSLQSREKSSLDGSNVFENNSADSMASASKTYNSAGSLNSFQRSISKFYRPQTSSSSFTRNSETKFTSPCKSSGATATTTKSTSSKISPRAGTSKPNAGNVVNFKENSEKPVKGNCALISRQRFKVVVPYQAQLIGIFKTLPSRNYGMLTFTVSFLNCNLQTERITTRKIWMKIGNCTWLRLISYALS